MPLQLTTATAEEPPATAEPPAKRVCTHATAGTAADAAALAVVLAVAPTTVTPLKWIFCFESLGDKKLLVIGQANNLDTALLNVNRSHAASHVSIRMQFRFRCAAMTLNQDRDLWLTKNYFESKLSRERRGYFDVPYEAVWRFFEKVIKPMHKYESEYAHEASSTSEEGSEDESDDDSEESEESEDEAAVTS